MLGISLITFILMNVVAGDPVLQLIDERQAGLDPVMVQNIRREWGLDKPLPIQYLQFIGHAVRGDLGRSYITREKVGPAIMERFPATAKLGLAALLFGTVIGVAAGTIAAAKRGTLFDSITMLLALAGISLPIFFLGMLMMYLFGVKWRLLPASGYGDGQLKYLIMPAVALGSGIVAVVARITRSAMLGVIKQDFITTARSKGLSEGRVIFKHALRNALIPVITIIGVQMGNVLSGAVITETVFNWPGVGRMLVDGINKRDLPMVQGVVIFVALLFALVNLGVDLVYASADPRIRYS
jgi:ABC-type dipeptide/oligopeptide/nickel transport system permease component